MITADRGTKRPPHSPLVGLHSKIVEHEMLLRFGIVMRTADGLDRLARGQGMQPVP
jgi:hypothetical protein